MINSLLDDMKHRTETFQEKTNKRFIKVCDGWFFTHLHAVSPTQSPPCSCHSHHLYGLEPWTRTWFLAWVHPLSWCSIWSSARCSSDLAGSNAGNKYKKSIFTTLEKMLGCYKPSKIWTNQSIGFTLGLISDFHFTAERFHNILFFMRKIILSVGFNSLI